MTESDISKIRIYGEEIVEQFDTHISWLLITEKHVYKIKKPVQYSFLDFSTLDKRKYYCEEELRLNRRLTKGIYLQVCEVKDRNNTFEIGGKAGKIVDYAVQMKRLPRDRQMHLLLDAGKVSPEEVEAIAVELVPFHQKAKIIEANFHHESVQSDFNDLMSVLPEAIQNGGAELPVLIQDAVQYSNNFIKKHEGLLKTRARNGMIRDCHGDLHSGNIFLCSPPVLFDCIEFNDSFRQIDLLNETAFFCMDMDAWNRSDLAECFMKKYLSLFPEVLRGPDEAELFVYYKLYRANVRLKVLLLKLLQHAQTFSSLQKAELMQEAGHYASLMKKYMRLSE